MQQSDFMAKALAFLSLVPRGRGHQIGPGRKTWARARRPSKSDKPGYIKPYIRIKNPKQAAAFHYHG